MTQNRRIILNIVATYARSLYVLAIGILCGRWTLMALGQTDYGLMGLIGGLVGFMTFFNGILYSAIGRYYAYVVGEAQTTGEAGLEKCRAWFTTGVVVHTVLPTILVLVGYPIGVWAVEDFLTIPANRVHDCIWVWRTVCLSCYLGMVVVPVGAMYKAKQYIAELTIYTFVTVTLNACFQYYMITHPGVWMVPLAFWNCVTGLLPNIIISVRAFYIFPECRFRWKYVNCLARLRELSGFAIWNTLPNIGCMFRGQGVAILVNKYLGPTFNAGMTVGNTLSSHTETLSGSLFGAFSPAICNAWGAGRLDFARALAFRAGKVGALLMLIFAIPLSLEVDEVLHLWLKNPPDYAALFCLYALATTVIDKTSWGHCLAMNANGNIKWYAIVLSPAIMLTFVIAWILLACGVGVHSIGIGMVSAVLVLDFGRLCFAQRIIGMNMSYWFRFVFAPLVVVVAIALGAGYSVRSMFEPSFWRVVVTTGTCLVAMLPLSWFIVLDKEEREYVRARAVRLLRLGGSHG